MLWLFMKKKLNVDLKKKNSKWAFQWKMQFNPDRDKQVNEVIFSRKSNSCSHSTVTFSNNGINNVTIRTVWALF